MTTRPPCQDVDPELFFPISYGSLASARQIEKARGVCGRCPVAVACLRAALDNPHIDDGIWAGTTPEQRRKLRKLQPERTPA